MSNRKFEIIFGVGQKFDGTPLNLSTEDVKHTLRNVALNARVQCYTLAFNDEGAWYDDVARKWVVEQSATVTVFCQNTEHAKLAQFAEDIRRVFWQSAVVFSKTAVQYAVGTKTDFNLIP